ncbi:MAG: tRNA threonylcarbamoyladenosine biosynthesis protein TsaB [Porticoccaceae bacterium]|jgi:tRNA threonylcarbamoyladenosine biosynthesis protein TsaB
MTTALAIETSTTACSVALLYQGKMTRRYSEEPRSHTRLVMSMVDQVLSEAGAELSQLDVIGTSVGPGSFTGLRIGFAVVQGLAFGLDIPVIPMSSLHVMTASYCRLTGDASNCEPGLTRIIMPVIDARMNEFNCGCYEVNDLGFISSLIKDQLLPRSDALALVEAHKPAVIIGEGHILFPDEAVGSEPLVAVYPDAQDLLHLAVEGFRGEMAVPVNRVELVYLRGTDAWQKRKRLRDA